MRRLAWISLLTALLAPAVAHARPLDDFRAAKLQAAAGTLTITETRCPPGSTECARTRVDETFGSGAKPRTRAEEGLPGFPTGIRLLGTGSSKCEMESPTTIVTAPDGSVQFLGSAARLVPGSFEATRIVVAGTRRGVRVAWLEPLAPSVACNYFGQDGTELALPQSPTLPSELVAPAIGARVLKRARFSVTVEGSKDWAETAADGMQVTGRASWKLRLDYAARSRG